MVSDLTATLPRAAICPFFQTVEPGAVTGVAGDPDFLCRSDPTDLVVPTVSYTERYCSTAVHRDCARFRAAIMVSRRSSGADPFSHTRPPWIRLLASPLPLLGVLVFGIVVGLVGTAAVTVTAQPPPPVVAPDPAAGPTPAPVPTAVVPPLPVAGRKGLVVDPARTGLNIREQPSTLAQSVGALKDGDEVDLLGERTVDGRRWFNLRYGGVTGWSVAEFVTPR